MNQKLLTPLTIHNSTASDHLSVTLKPKELDANPVRNFRTTTSDGKKYDTDLTIKTPL